MLSFYKSDIIYINISDYTELILILFEEKLLIKLKVFINLQYIYYFL